MTGLELRLGVVRIALSWVGVHELTPRHKELIDYYNKLFGYRVYRMQYTDPWCAAFVSAVGMFAVEQYKLGCAAYGLIPASAACDPMIAEYQRMGRWMENDGYVPSPGDVIFYDWQDNGLGDNVGSADHVGIVECVSGGTITVIEGNKSDAVGRRYIALNGQFIRGYGLPDYDRWAATASQEPEETTQDGQGVIILDNPESGTSGNDADSGASSGEKSHSTETGENGTSATPGAKATELLPVLRRGDGVGNPSEIVRAAQLLLIGRGFRCGPWGADGEFGSATYGAVYQFQRARGLSVDGVIGPETWAALLGVI